jgi:hypothetical protein
VSSERSTAPKVAVTTVGLLAAAAHLWKPDSRRMVASKKDF